MVITGIILYCHSLSTLLRGSKGPPSARTGAILQVGWQSGAYGREKRGFCERPRAREKGGEGLTSPKLLPHARNQEALLSKWSRGAASWLAPV